MKAARKSRSVWQFCIWKTKKDNRDFPIFRGTFRFHNTYDPWIHFPPKLFCILTNPQNILIADSRYLGHRGKTCDIIIQRGGSRAVICHGNHTDLTCFNSLYTSNISVNSTFQNSLWYLFFWAVTLKDNYPMLNLVCVRHDSSFPINRAFWGSQIRYPARSNLNFSGLKRWGSQPGFLFIYLWMLLIHLMASIHD